MSPVRYILKGLIGRGGSAEVHLAHEVHADGSVRPIVLKTFDIALTRHAELARGIAHEAAVGECLEHPFIVRTLAHRTSERGAVLILEYVDGPTLRQVVHFCRVHGARLTAAAAAYIVLCVCEALNYAWNARSPEGDPLHLIHRDIKPSNLMLDSYGRPRLMDFGIARSTLLTVQTRHGQFKGTYCYASPEQARGEVYLGRASDVFSLGAVFFELLTLERLFDAPNDAAALLQIVDADLETRFQRLSADAAPLLPVLRRMLARPLEARYRHTEAVAHDLRAAFLELPGSAQAGEELRRFAQLCGPPPVEPDRQPQGAPELPWHRPGATLDAQLEETEPDLPDTADVRQMTADRSTKRLETPLSMRRRAVPLPALPGDAPDHPHARPAALARRGVLAIAVLMTLLLIWRGALPIHRTGPQTTAAHGRTGGMAPASLEVTAIAKAPPAASDRRDDAVGRLEPPQANPPATTSEPVPTPAPGPLPTRTAPALRPAHATTLRQPRGAAPGIALTGAASSAGDSEPGRSDERAVPARETASVSPVPTRPTEPAGDAGRVAAAASTPSGLPADAPSRSAISPTATDLARVSISSEPYADLSIDGAFTARGPTRQKLAPGTHTLVLRTVDGREKVLPIELDPGRTYALCWSFETQRLSCDLPPFRTTEAGR